MELLRTVSLSENKDKYAIIGIDPDKRTVRWVEPTENKDFYTSRQAAHRRREQLEEQAMQAQELKEFKAAIKATLNAFIESSDFEAGCTSATKASWGGSGYSVELFTDGTWRVLWDNAIGNKYETPGVILSLPAINDDEYQQLVVEEEMEEDEFFNLGFGNEYDDLAKELRDHLSDDFAMRYSN